MRLSSSFRPVFVALALVAVACQSSATDSGETSGAAAAEATCDAASEKVDGLTIAHKSWVRVERAPEDTIDKEWRPDFTDCNFTVNYIQISGLTDETAQTKINEALAARAKAEACQSPWTSESTQSVHFVDAKTKMILSVTTSEYYDGGGAHPEYGTSYQNFDLATGELITLDKVLQPGALKVLSKGVGQNIGRSFSVKGATRWATENGRVTPGQKRSGPLTADEQAEITSGRDVMVQGAKNLFRDVDGNKSQLKDLTDFALGSATVELDLINYLPHAVKALAEPIPVKYSDFLSAKVVGTSDLAKRLFASNTAAGK